MQTVILAGNGARLKIHTTKGNSKIILVTHGKAKTVTLRGNEEKPAA